MGRTVIFAVLLVIAVGGGAIGSPAERERHEVDISRSPWSAIGRVNNGGYSRCTGILVSQRIALTAAHCLYNKRAKRFFPPQSAFFMLGYNRGKHLFSTRAARIVIAPGYQPAAGISKISSDWALLLLKEPAPEVIEPLPIADAGNVAGELVAAGYASDRAHILTHSGPCNAAVMSGDGLLVSDCDLPDGYSGGPLLEPVSGQMVGLNLARGMSEEKIVGLAIAPAAWRSALSGLLADSVAVEDARRWREGFPSE